MTSVGGAIVERLFIESRWITRGSIVAFVLLCAIGVVGEWRGFPISKLGSLLALVCTIMLVLTLSVAGLFAPFM